jgi:hypothetical protein
MASLITPRDWVKRPSWVPHSSKLAYGHKRVLSIDGGGIRGIIVGMQHAVSKSFILGLSECIDPFRVESNLKLSDPHTLYPISQRLGTRSAISPKQDKAALLHGYAGKKSGVRSM